VKTLIVLAGGFGTRLKSVVSDLPKPLAPVDNNSFLKLLILNWVSQGVTKFILLLHYKPKKFIELIDSMQADGSLDGVEVDYIIERIPLGTGGSIANAINVLNITESFLVTNADTWLDSGLIELSSNSPCCIGVIRAESCERYGAILLRENKIIKFIEKNQTEGSGIINAGIYHLIPSIFENIKNDIPVSLEREIFPELSSSGKIDGILLDGNFIDIGVPKDYTRFCKWITDGKKNEL